MKNPKAVTFICLAIALSTSPLAQLVDLLPNRAWNALNAAGMLAPLVGLLISLATRSMTSWKRKAVVIFYGVSLPLAGLVLLALRPLKVLQLPYPTWCLPSPLGF